MIIWLLGVVSISSLSRVVPSSPPPPTRRHVVPLLPTQIDAHRDLRRRLLFFLAEDQLLRRRTRGENVPAVAFVHPPRSRLTTTPSASFSNHQRLGALLADLDARLLSASSAAPTTSSRLWTACVMRSGSAQPPFMGRPGVCGSCGCTYCASVWWFWPCSQWCCWCPWSRPV